MSRGIRRADGAYGALVVDRKWFRMTRGELAGAFLDRLLGDGGAPAIDWDRFRLMQLIPGTAGVDAATRDRLVARGFVEIAKGRFDAETEARSIASLRALVGQVIGARWHVVAHDNPMLAALSHGPVPTTPPNLARLLSAVAEIVSHAEAVTIAAESDPLCERLMTLLFVDGKYVGFLPGRRELLPAPAPKA